MQPTNAMSPIDYNLDVQTPFQAALQGYQTGSAIRTDQLAQQQQQLAIQQQRAQQTALLSLLNNPNPTADDYAKFIAAAPQMKDAVQASWNMRNTAQQQNDLQHVGQIHAALVAGQPDIAKSLLDARTQALENAGRMEDAQHSRIMANMLADHNQDGAVPGAKLAERMAGTFLAAIPGGPEMIKAARDAAMTPASIVAADADARKARSEADIKGAEAGNISTKLRLDNQNITSQIAERAARLRLDQDKLTTDTQVKLSEITQKYGQLPDDARKLVNDSAVTASSSEAAVQQYQQLAGKIDALGGSWGSGGTSSAGEWLARAWGNEDAVSALKREYTRMASQGVIKLLPPGPASDKDIANAKEGIPNANASPAAVSSYLRGMAKLSAYDAVLNNAKAEWAGAVQHLGRTKTDIVIDGTRVPAGTTFNDFARGYLANKAEALDSAARVGGRGYMRFATPPTSSPSAGAPESSGGATGAY